MAFKGLLQGTGLHFPEPDQISATDRRLGNSHRCSKDTMVLDEKRHCCYSLASEFFQLIKGFTLTFPEVAVK
jgi:hypothetical protein